MEISFWIISSIIPNSYVSFPFLVGLEWLIGDDIILWLLYLNDEVSAERQWSNGGLWSEEGGRSRVRSGNRRCPPGVVGGRVRGPVGRGGELGESLMGWCVGELFCPSHMGFGPLYRGFGPVGLIT